MLSLQMSDKITSHSDLISNYSCTICALATHLLFFGCKSTCANRITCGCGSLFAIFVLPVSSNNKRNFPDVICMKAGLSHGYDVWLVEGPGLSCFTQGRPGGRVCMNQSPTPAVPLVCSDFVCQIHFVNGVSMYSTNVNLCLEGPPGSLGFRVRLGLTLG